VSYFARLAGRAQAAPMITPVLASSSPLAAFDQRLNQPGFAELAPVAVEAPGVPLAWADIAGAGAGEPPTDPFESSPSAENLLEPARGIAAAELGMAPPGAPLVSHLEATSARAPRPSAPFSEEGREPALPLASPVSTFARAWARTETKAVATPAPLPPGAVATGAFDATQPGAAFNEALPSAERGPTLAAVESARRAATRELEPLGREPEPTAARGTLPASVATDARFPANLRDALAQVEAWMGQGANEPYASTSATPRSSPRPAAGPDLSSALSAGTAEQMRETAPRLSIGHIQVEVVTSEPAPQAPVWPAPQRAAAAPSSSSRHRGRLGFGVRQG
jgi:hypothetical protein